MALMWRRINQLGAWRKCRPLPAGFIQLKGAKSERAHKPAPHTASPEERPPPVLPEQGTEQHYNRHPITPHTPSVMSNRFSEEAELDDAVHTALLTMREGFEGEMTEKNIEVQPSLLTTCFFG